MSGIIINNPYPQYIPAPELKDVNEVLRCKSCGAPRKPYCSQCEYCRSYFKHKTEEYTGGYGSGIITTINSLACSGLLLRFNYDVHENF